MDSTRAARTTKERFRLWRGSLFLLPLCVYFCLKRGDYTLIDAADLIIHEAGHFFFAFFGQFLRMAGGTLMQILLPSLIAWHFFAHEYRFGAQVALLWLGQNFINISVYAADAQVRVLPLLGGPHSMHDWFYMLSRLGLLRYDAQVGYFFFGLAILTFIALLLLPRVMVTVHDV